MVRLLLPIMFPLCAVAQGINIPMRATVQDIREVNRLGAKIVRYQIAVGDNHPSLSNGTDYRIMVSGALDNLDVLLSYCDAKVIIAVMSAPSGKTVVSTVWARSVLLGVVRQIALRYKNDRRIIGIEPLNEPAGSIDEVWKFNRLLEESIHSIAPRKVVVLSSPRGTTSGLKYLGTPNTWYTVHMYTPMKVTHQGVYYPIGVVWRSSVKKIEAYLKNVIAFKNKFKVPVFIGEFSFSNYGDRASQKAWLTDVIRVCRKYKLIWAYHIYGESYAWDVVGNASLWSLLYYYYNH